MNFSLALVAFLFVIFPLHYWVDEHILKWYGWGLYMLWFIAFLFSGAATLVLGVRLFA